MKNIGAQVIITHSDLRNVTGVIHSLAYINKGSGVALEGNVYFVKLDKPQQLKDCDARCNFLDIHESYLDARYVTAAELACGEVARLIHPNNPPVHGSIVFKQANGNIVILSGGTRAGDGWPQYNTATLRFERVEQNDVPQLTRK